MHVTEVPSYLESLCIDDLVIVSHTAQNSTQTHTHTQQQSSFVGHQGQTTTCYKARTKLLALLSSVSVSTGNEQANRQTEIITDQTIAVISFFRPPGPAFPPTQFTSICVHLVDSVIQSMPE